MSGELKDKYPSELSDEEKRIIQKIITKNKQATDSTSMSVASDLDVETLDRIWSQTCNKIQAKLTQSEQERERLHSEWCSERDRALALHQKLMNACRLWAEKQAEVNAHILQMEKQNETQARILRETEQKLSVSDGAIAELQTKLDKQIQSSRRLQKFEKEDAREQDRLRKLRLQLDVRDSIIQQLKLQEVEDKAKIEGEMKRQAVEMEMLKQQLAACRTALTSAETKIGGMTEENQSHMEYIQRLESVKMEWKPLVDDWIRQNELRKQWEWHTMGGLYAHGAIAMDAAVQPPPMG